LPKKGRNLEIWFAEERDMSPPHVLGRHVHKYEKAIFRKTNVLCMSEQSPILVNEKNPILVNKKSPISDQRPFDI